VWDHQGVRHGIVQGEPGIFPEPVTRVLRAVGRLFGRRDDPGPPPQTPPSRADGPAEGPTDGPGGGTADVSDLDPVRPQDET
jgi:hypothetical protein